jgi:hypothetical protein
MKYWMSIYLSYATSGTNLTVPFRPARRDELLLFEQVARAMEIFAIAHEYGHHNLNHGRTLDSANHAEEFQADQFALRICYEVERFPFIFNNPYLSSGAGGCILLLALQTLRSVQYIIGGEALPTDTHPSALSRIKRFDSVALLKPEEFKHLKEYRTASSRIMTFVESILLPSLRELPVETLVEIRSFRAALTSR